jgi:hypothetical protein
MRPQSMTWYTLILSLALAACDNTNDSSDTEADADTDSDSDSDTDPQVVWEAERAETSASFTGLYASGQGLYVVSTGGLLWTFKQASGWEDPEDLDIGDEDLNDVWGIGAGAGLEMMAVGDAGWTMHWYDGGPVTRDLGTANFEGIDGPSAQLLYAVGWGGIYKWDGFNWAYEPVPPGSQVNDVWATVDDAYAVGENGLILHRINGEKGWEAMTSPTNLALFAIGGATVLDLWAVGQDGVLLNFDGAVWTEQTRFTGQSLWDVWGIQNNAVYTVGSSGVAYKWDSEIWTPLPTGVDNVLYAVHGASGTDVWAVGNRGMAIHYTED